MENYKRLTAKDCVDAEAECLYQYVYGINDRYNPHCHEFYEIVITISGTVIQETNGKILNLPEGSLIFIRPDDVHGYIYDTPESNETTYINLTFTKETAEKLFDYFSDEQIVNNLLFSDMPPIVLLSNREKNQVLEQISQLNIVNWQDKKALKLKMRAILADIFVKFFFKLSENKDNKIPEWLSELIIEMKKTENFVAGTEKMIKLSGKTREHLARCIKSYLGITLSEFINELRINYISNLLIHTNINIIDMCYECGFQSLSNFYRIFKDKYGVSPTTFRQQYKQM
ncbi:MAG: AraC family transcriptional regulator [Clostridia bacterium]|nr:AraC family transcriptional regulator [Clostridia bacterium]